jgi:hypothetical protein
MMKLAIRAFHENAINKGTYDDSGCLFCHQSAHTLSKCSQVTIDIMDMNCCRGGEPGAGAGKCSTGAGDALMPVRPVDMGMSTLKLRAVPICKNEMSRCKVGGCRMRHQSSRCHVDGAADAVEPLRQKHCAANPCSGINSSLDGI